jgi:phage I-like protein
MTITTTTTPAPGQSTHDQATGDYAGYLETLRYVKDRETAAQVLDSMVAAAASTARLFRRDEELAPSGTRRQRLTALSALASGAWQNAALGWAETATLVCRESSSTPIHPEGLKRLAEAAAALTTAPWGMASQPEGTRPDDQP